MIHLQVGESDAVDRAELVLVLGDQVRAQRRAVRGDLEHPRVAVVQVPVRSGDVGQPAAPVGRSAAGCAPRDGVEHEVEQFGLARHVAVERHGRHLERVGDPAHRQRGEPLARRRRRWRPRTMSATCSRGLGPRRLRSCRPHSSSMLRLGSPPPVNSVVTRSLTRLQLRTAYSNIRRIPYGVQKSVVPALDIAIMAEGLEKRYGETTALDGVDLTSSAGRYAVCWDPTARARPPPCAILATLLRPDGGRAAVAGFDVARQPDEVRAASVSSASTPRSTRSSAAGRTW